MYGNSLYGKFNKINKIQPNENLYDYINNNNAEPIENNISPNNANKNNEWKTILKNGYNTYNNITNSGTNGSNGLISIGQGAINGLNALRNGGSWDKSIQSSFGIDSDNDNDFIQAVKGTVNGAKMGSTFGPLGAAIGGSVGLLSSFFDDLH